MPAAEAALSAVGVGTAVHGHLTLLSVGPQEEHVRGRLVEQLAALATCCFLCALLRHAAAGKTRAHSWIDRGLKLGPVPRVQILKLLDEAIFSGSGHADYVHRHRAQQAGLASRTLVRTWQGKKCSLCGVAGACASHTSPHCFWRRRRASPGDGWRRVAVALAKGAPLVTPGSKWRRGTVYTYMFANKLAS